jgi:hypothetical protein
MVAKLFWFITLHLCKAQLAELSAKSYELGLQDGVNSALVSDESVVIPAETWSDMSRLKAQFTSSILPLVWIGEK